MLSMETYWSMETFKNGLMENTKDDDFIHHHMTTLDPLLQELNFVETIHHEEVVANNPGVVFEIDANHEVLQTLNSILTKIHRHMFDSRKYLGTNSFTWMLRLQDVFQKFEGKLVKAGVS